MHVAQLFRSLLTTGEVLERGIKSACLAVPLSGIRPKTVLGTTRLQLA
jgi:hypothetical protein